MRRLAHETTGGLDRSTAMDAIGDAAAWDMQNVVATRAGFRPAPGRVRHGSLTDIGGLAAGITALAEHVSPTGAVRLLARVGTALIYTNDTTQDFAGGGQATSLVHATNAVRMAPAQQSVYVADGDGPVQRVLGLAGNYVAVTVPGECTAGLATTATANRFGSSGPGRMTRDASGNLWVLDPANARVLKYNFSSGNPQGEYVGAYNGDTGTGGRLVAPVAITHSATHIFILNSAVGAAPADYWVVKLLASDGSFVAQWGASGSGAGQYTRPTGIAVSAAGEVYTVDNNGTPGTASKIIRTSAAGVHVADYALTAMSDCDGLLISSVYGATERLFTTYSTVAGDAIVVVPMTGGSAVGGAQIGGLTVADFALDFTYAIAYAVQATTPAVYKYNLSTGAVSIYTSDDWGTPVSIAHFDHVQSAHQGFAVGDSGLYQVLRAGFEPHYVNEGFALAALPAPTRAPTAALSTTGAGGMPVGTYQVAYSYKVWRSIAWEESGLSPAASLDAEVDTYDTISISGFAEGAVYAEFHPHLCVYVRAGLSGGEWLKVFELPVLVTYATTAPALVYSATSASGWAWTTIAPAAVGVPPLDVTLLAPYANRMLYARGDTLYVSNYGDPDHVPDAYAFDDTAPDAGGSIVVGADGQDITGLLVVGDVCIVAKRHGVWLLTGQSALPSFGLRQLHGALGCVRHETMAECDGIGLWLDASGRVVSFDGTSIGLALGTPVAPMIAAAHTIGYRAMAFAVYDPSRRWYALTIPGDGTQATGTTYVFQFEEGAWTRFTLQPNRCATYAPHAATPGVYAGDAYGTDSKGVLYRMYTGGRVQDDGVTRAFTWLRTTKAWPAQGRVQSVRLVSQRVYAARAFTSVGIAVGLNGTAPGTAITVPANNMASGYGEATVAPPLRSQARTHQVTVSGTCDQEAESTDSYEECIVSVADAGVSR